MGISGLLHLLKPITQKIHIKQYAGQTVAIDGHVLLHRGAFGAASKIANNQSTDSYIQYFMFYIGLFRHFGVTPLVVFDGLPLPLKQITNNDRRTKRDAKLAEGMRYQFQGDHTKAQKCFQQSISISEDMIRSVILELQKQKVEVIVAPYESDAQLAHLLKTNKAAAVVSEDSDLLVFGCPRVIYKLTREGDGEQINYEDIFTLNQEKLNQLTPDLFRQMCMLSGCDYLPSLSGMGLKTAIKKIRHDFSIDTALRITVGSGDRYLDYRREFDQAEMGFLYQWVYDSDEKDYIRLNPLPDHLNETEADMLLGPKPTVKQLSILRVNKIIPNKRTENNNTQQQKIQPIPARDISTVNKTIITLSVDKMQDIHIQSVHTNQEQFITYFQHKTAYSKTRTNSDESCLRSSIYTHPSTLQTKTADIGQTTSYASWVFGNKHKPKQYRPTPTLHAVDRPPHSNSQRHQPYKKPTPRLVLGDKSTAIINQMIQYCDDNKENIPISSTKAHTFVKSDKMSPGSFDQPKKKESDFMKSVDNWVSEVAYQSRQTRVLRTLQTKKNTNHSRKDISKNYSPLTPNRRL
ncbi:PIN domain-like protein [Choanephora cucurbitarum]|nr:PIN domain-like protein [Choanephora cucurbitarum]